MLGRHKSRVSALHSLIASGLIPYFFLFVFYKTAAIWKLLLYVVALEPIFDIIPVIFEIIYSCLNAFYLFFSPAEGLELKISRYLQNGLFILLFISQNCLCRS